MSGLLRADWLRIRRRWETWIISVGIVALSLLGYLNGAHSARTTFSTPDGAIIHVSDPAPYTFPQSIATALTAGGVWFIFGFAFLTASLLGSEFDWGTIRNVALFRPDRRRYVAARLIWVLGFAAAVFVAIVAIGFVGPIAIPVEATDGASFGPAASAVSLQTALVLAVPWVVTGLAAIGLAGAAALVLRSAATGVLAAAVYAFADMFIANFLIAQLGRPISVLAQLSLTTRLMDFQNEVSRAVTTPSVTVGGGPETQPGWVDLPPVAAAALLVLWIGGLFGLWFWRISTVDIHE